MRDTDRIIGSLEEFKEWSKREFDEIKDDIEKLREEVKSLNHYKWKVIGGATAVSMILAGALEVLKTTNQLPWKGN
jgi:hypothetical protein